MRQFLLETPLGEVLTLISRASDLQRPSGGYRVAPSSSASSSNSSRSSFGEKYEDRKPILRPWLPLADGYLTWADKDDPKVWSMRKRIWVVFVIVFYTFVFCASTSIYTVSIPGVVIEYKVTEQKALLGLSLYVLSFGLGPLLWGPLTEVNWIGRNPVYIGTGLMFFVLSYPTAIVRSFSGFLALRFFQGFFGSPCLANGGATMHDIFDELELPYGLGVWVFFAYAGPGLGPVMASYAVSHGWRISLWRIAYLVIPLFVLLLLLPETFFPKIKTRRNVPEHQSDSQKQDPSYPEQASTHKDGILQTLKESLTKPLQISLLDPSVTFVNVYTSFCYATYYTFFDAVPLAYVKVYGFTIGQLGLSFISIMIGCAIGAIAYFAYIYFVANPAIRSGNNKQENRLIPALFAVWALPVGILIFGWASRPDIHWIVGMLGIAIYSGGVYVIFQCLILYVLQSYPAYAASLFAANDACRSILAAAAVHFAVPLYENLGIGKGCSVLAGVSGLGIVGMFVLYWKGAQLRAKSKFTAK